MINSKTIIAIPPGATIKEQLINRQIKQKEFAIRMGLSEKHVSNLINGNVELTKDVALKLEFVLGVPASFWNNLETKYREKLKRVMEENSLDEDAKFTKLFPYSKMAKFGWVKDTRKPEEKAINLRKFFEVAKLEALCKLSIPGIACRQLGANEMSDYSLAVWSQRAKLEARKYELSAININKLKKRILEIRKMTIENPEDFCEKLLDLLKRCGIALVFLPHIGGSFLHGATFYDGKHIVMGLTVRGKYADKFWFSLFHELFHIIEGHINNPNGTSNEDEQNADLFARDILIPKEKYEQFIQEKLFTKESILKFSKLIEIAPGIVVGRLQKDNYIPYNRFNSIKEKYNIE